MKQDDYVSMVQSFGRYLQIRGHNDATIVSLFKEAALHIDHNEPITSIAARETAMLAMMTNALFSFMLNNEYHPK
jgi:hypothetical protein